MKKRMIVMIAALLALGLASCAATPESDLALVEYDEYVYEQTEDIEIADEHTDEDDYDVIVQEDEEDDRMIDFSFTQTINSELAPFTFRILGERVNPPRVRINSIHISDTDGEIIQKIDGIGVWNDWPRNISAHNRYGLEFGDFNSDGYLDMSMRRFSGAGWHGRTHFYWLWDSEAGQFVYCWKLSEAVTEENLIDFTLTQSIHEDMPPFTIRLLGRWIKGWCFEARGEVDGVQANIHVLQVMDAAGNVLQEFDRLGTLPPQRADSFGLHFADYNFDGFLDMALYVHEGGSMRNAPHLYWLWDTAAGQFVRNNELERASDFATVSIIEGQQRLRVFTRVGAFGNFISYMEYIDGVFVTVATWSEEWGAMPDGQRYTRIAETDLIAGTEVVTYIMHDDDTAD